MKIVLSFLIVLMLTGCSIFRPTEDSINEPKLLKQSTLPGVPVSLATQELEIYCEMLIKEDGSVGRAKLLKGSGDKTWDYLAEQSLLKWEYAPALYNGKPIQMLVRRNIRVVFAKSEEIPLCEIACDDIAVAESVYNALKLGADFAEMASKYSINPSKDNGGFLGKVNIHYYSGKIKAIISNLSEDEFTRPVPYGQHFVIFKRLRQNKIQDL
jgi:hypothetical protein